MANFLVIDDVDMDRAITTKALRDLGHNVTGASDAEQGIELARTMRPDAIFMDVVMLPMDGFAACRKISRDEELSSIPVVMCTSKGKETDKMWAERQGAVDYVVKPATKESIHAVLVNILK